VDSRVIVASFLQRKATSRDMCEKCSDLDEMIARCQRLLAMVTDRLAIDGIEGLLKSYLAQRHRLHPESEPAE
jgi:hypothetical protein